MDYRDFEQELNYLLDLNDIEVEPDPKKNRNDAIRILLELKSKKSNIIVNDQDIINVYEEDGIEGIQKMFKRDVCYFYSTNFCYDILFYHYKNKWKEIEILINKEINERRSK